MKSGNGGIHTADDDSRNTSLGQDADAIASQGELYAPPPESYEADRKRNHVSDYHTGVEDVQKPNSAVGDWEATLKVTLEKALEKVKESLPAESLDKVLQTILVAFRDAQSSTKGAVQRVKDHIAAILPTSHHSEVEAIVDDVERQMLSKSEAPEISSKL